jgi:hypothetical protein
MWLWLREIFDADALRTSRISIIMGELRDSAECSGIHLREELARCGHGMSTGRFYTLMSELQDAGQVGMADRLIPITASRNIRLTHFFLKDPRSGQRDHHQPAGRPAGDS